MATRPAITVWTSAELTGKSGSFGNYVAEVTVTKPDGSTDVIPTEVGAIVVATGFDTYQPEAGELGYGIEGVLTLPDFKALVDAAEGPLTYQGRRVGAVAYIYCVGSRQKGGQRVLLEVLLRSHDPRLAAGRRARPVGEAVPPQPRHPHLREARAHVHRLAPGGLGLPEVPRRHPADRDPTDSGGLLVSTTDVLTEGLEVTLPVDLVVLVTGMVPRENAALTDLLKLPLGTDGFYNEIHPKLRPVETVVDGVLIAGTCQGPKTAPGERGLGARRRRPERCPAQEGLR